MSLSAAAAAAGARYTHRTRESADDAEQQRADRHEQRS